MQNSFTPGTSNSRYGNFHPNSGSVGLRPHPATIPHPIPSQPVPKGSSGLANTWNSEIHNSCYL